MSVTFEQRMQRKNTAAMIEANPQVIELIPTIKDKTATGFTQSDGPARVAQTFRLVDLSSAFVGNNPGLLRSSEGQGRKITHQLLGYYNAVMQVGDHWSDTSTGARYEIDELLPDNGYERRAKVIRYGL